ncbi:diguanylate cyclase domain-containing protein [Vibrio sp.]|uniref:diguanylate cyclase domain-containing protein n=1 Tax=Vibrio sp. TaxID=678 RepID=UPI003D108D2D
MIDSLRNKLVVLVVASFALTALIILSLFKISGEQRSIEMKLNQLVNIQLSVDHLRSQLWVFSQYGDTATLNQVGMAQMELAKQLQNYGSQFGPLANIGKMNNSLDLLLKQEQSLSHTEQASTANEPIGSIVNAHGLLHSRYNVLIQNMTEELVHAHQRVLSQAEQAQQQVLVMTALSLVFVSLLVSYCAWKTLEGFQRGMNGMQLAMLELSKGEFGYQQDRRQLTTEFVKLADFFDHMSHSLNESMVSKQDLEQEVKRQTEVLRQQKQQLLFLSEHDPLTNLMNRRAFEKTLSRAIINSNRTGLSLALIFVDLDDFKLINDSIGHDAGDQVLRVVAERLVNCVRETDFVGRYGGDEFVVCLDLMRENRDVCKKIDEIALQLNKPVTHGERLIHVAASLGVCYYPQQAVNMQQLIKFADQAMYLAKHQSNCKYCEHPCDNRPIQELNKTQ